jgi:RNA polymerase sigma-32 factor
MPAALPPSFAPMAMLAPDAERRLLARAAGGCRRAEAALVASHAPLVRRLARAYARHGVPQQDLVQEGLIGLLHAVRRFDPAKEARLATYAAWWVRAAMQEHVVRTWSVVRTGKTAPHRAAFFALKRKAAELQTTTAQLGAETMARLAARFRLPFEEVAGLAQRIAGGDRAVLPDDAPAEGGPPTPEDLAAAASERRHRRSLIEQALAALPGREAAVVRRRHLAAEPPSLSALAADMGISKARVRQLEQRALARLRELLGPRLAEA